MAAHSRKKEERLLIGKEIYEGKYSLAEAAEIYMINKYTARDYLRAYKAAIGVPQMIKDRIWEKPCEVWTENNYKIECFTEKEYGRNGLYFILQQKASKEIEQGESIIFGRQAFFKDEKLCKEDNASQLRLYVVRKID